ncbi:MAG TPA: hypothetical protein PKZ75_10700, partial [Bacteroidia bacterium]|nr:hypothetical protein [Bacteroidia bacterium]
MKSTKNKLNTIGTLFYLLLLILCTQNYFGQITTLTITTTGAGSWTAPCGVSNATIICIGAGGGGGGGNGASRDGGGGGGGGGCAIYNGITVTGGTTYNYTVGVGGSGGAQGANGTAGGFSQMIIGATTIKGFGGALGNRAANGAGGLGGTASGGTSNFSGGNGATGVSGTGSGGGGEGASSSGVGNNAVTQTGGTGNTNGGDGGNGKTGANGSGNVGTAPGGGGGGGNGTGTGAAGGNGQIVIMYPTPSVSSNAGPDQTVCTSAATLAGNAVAGYTGAWTCITNCGGVSITTPSSATSGVTGLTSGVATTFQWVLTETATGCVLTGDQVIITRTATCPPANDDPSGATPITAGASCSYTTFTNANATASSCGTIPAPGCSSYSGGDVWFSITVPASGSITFDSQTGVMTDGGLAVYSGTPCGVLTLVGCDDDSSPNGAMPMLTVSGQTPGSTLYIRFWEYGNDNNGTFGLCATAITPPSNDDPSGATPITAGASCSYTTFTNANATASSCGTIPAPGCSSYLGSDVWFSVTVPASGSINFDSQTGVMTDGGMAVYSGTPCGVLTLVGCDDDSSPNGSMPMLTVSGQTPGSTLYVRFWEYGNDNNGTFGLCATAITPPSNDNCSGSYSVAVSTTSLCVSSTTATSTNATQSLAGCTGNADDDVWFSFVASSNTHSIVVTPGTINNAVFEVFTGSCAGLTTYSCVNNTTGSSVESSIIEGLNIGTTYYVRVYSNGNNTNTGTFSVCINTPVNPCSSITNIASCGSSISTSFAAGTGLYATSACGWSTDGYEKIFTFTPATTGNYFIQQGSSFAYIDYQFKAVSGGCSSSGWTCVDDISGAGTSATAMALTAGVQYYILLDPESTAG